MGNWWKKFDYVSPQNAGNRSFLLKRTPIIFQLTLRIELVIRSTVVKTLKRTRIQSNSHILLFFHREIICSVNLFPKKREQNLVSKKNFKHQKHVKRNMLILLENEIEYFIKAVSPSRHGLSFKLGWSYNFKFAEEENNSN